MIENAIQDVRYAIRQLRKSPGFACTAIFILALGIAAAVAIFGFVDAALIKALPYRDQSRLVAVFESSPGNERSTVSYFDFQDWKRLNNIFSSIDAFALNGGFTLTSASGAEQVSGTRVSSGFFRTLGVVLPFGRDFQAGEGSAGGPRTLILSYAAWRKRFGGRQDVLGRTVTLNGAPTIIVGVLPRDFQFAPYGSAEFWTTLQSSDPCEKSRECHNLITIARLKHGVSLKTASSAMRSITRQLQKQYPESNQHFGSADVISLRDEIVGDVRPTLLLLLSGAGLLLLIACVNVTTLLLTRSEKRQREIAVRRALGASASRLFHQFAIEGFVLAALGGCLGLIFAQVSMRLLANLVPIEKLDTMPYLRGLGLNPLTTLFACSLSLLAGVLFAVVPVARASLSGMIEGLKEGARGSAGTMWRRLGSHLVIIEVAITMVLMVGAGLLAKSLYLLLHVDVGFRPDHLVVLQTSWAPEHYSTDQQKIALEREIINRISILPGVKSVAVSTAPPVDSAWGTASFHVAGRSNDGEHNEVLNRQVSAMYFPTLQVRLLRGRYFRQDEDASKPLVAVVNRTLMNKYFAGEDPIGKQIYYEGQSQSRMQIIGVVDDIKEGPLEGEAWPVLYVPYNQNPVAWPAVLVRTLQRETSLFPNITGAVHEVDPFVSVSKEQTMTERINQSPAAYLRRSSAMLTGAFALTAFLLSLVGLYGVVAYSVSQRTREIGVRMALGAERSAMYQLILREAGRLAVWGILAGLACSLGATRLLRALLFAVHSWDLPTLTGAAFLLALSALLASYIPARRAASVNPIEALRTE
jgi:macrolide transport system ATP-binding/permease protein